MFQLRLCLTQGAPTVWTNHMVSGLELFAPGSWTADSVCQRYSPLGLFHGCPTFQLPPKLGLRLPPPPPVTLLAVHTPKTGLSAPSKRALGQGVTHAEPLPCTADEMIQLCTCHPADIERPGMGKESAAALEGGNLGGSSPISGEFSAAKSPAAIS